MEVLRPAPASSVGELVCGVALAALSALPTSRTLAQNRRIESCGSPRPAAPGSPSSENALSALSKNPIPKPASAGLWSINARATGKSLTRIMSRQTHAPRPRRRSAAFSVPCPFAGVRSPKRSAGSGATRAKPGKPGAGSASNGRCPATITTFRSMSPEPTAVCPWRTRLQDVSNRSDRPFRVAAGLRISLARLSPRPRSLRVWLASYTGPAWVLLRYCSGSDTVS